ncbi:MAG: FAD-dependent oxidoreductase, partial [Polyangiaceae bacterium]
SRAQVMELLRFFKMRVPGFENARLAATATQIGIRESRRIVGEYTLTANDVREARHFPDAVARSAYPIDIHNPTGSGTTTVRLPQGRAYEIPYRCLVPLEIENLAVAGRCISTTHEAHATTRLTPTVMTLGQAAGTAAALSLANDTPFRRVDTSLLCEQLVADGVDLRHT